MIDAMGDWEDRLHKPVIHLADQLKGIRSGTIDAGFVETFRISWQGRAVSRSAGWRRSLANRAGSWSRRSSGPMVPAVVKALSRRSRMPMPSIPLASRSRCPRSAASSGPRSRRHVKALGEQAKVGIRSTRQEIRKRLAAAGRRPERVDPGDHRRGDRGGRRPDPQEARGAGGLIQVGGRKVLDKPVISSARSRR